MGRDPLVTRTGEHGRTSVWMILLKLQMEIEQRAGRSTRALRTLRGNQNNVASWAVTLRENSLRAPAAVESPRDLGYAST